MPHHLAQQPGGRCGKPTQSTLSRRIAGQCISVQIQNHTTTVEYINASLDLTFKNITMFLIYEKISTSIFCENWRGIEGDAIQAKEK